MDFETEVGHVGVGWQPIVRELHAKVLEIDPDIEVEQIKEKFGGLRYYFTSRFAFPSDENDQINALVAAAEAKCDVTCEDCGEVGSRVSISGWLRTLCKQHENEARERRARTWRTEDGG